MSSTRPASPEDPRGEDYLPVRAMPAWAMSLLVHVSVLTVLGLTMQFTPRGAAVEPGRTGGIVLARQTDQRTEYFDAQDQAAASAASASAATRAEPFDPLPNEQAVSLDLAGALPAAEESLAATAGGGLLPSAGDLTSGTAPNRSVGGAIETGVFGVKGTGSRFVYVFDRSGSMEGYGGRPLAAAKSELIASLRHLDRIHQFQIIFYNEQPRVFNPTGTEPRMAYGDDQTKLLAERFVNSIVAAGGTRHMQALEMALKLRPDVIFFLTDADEPQLTPDDLARIHRLNSSTSINAIEFGFGPFLGGDNFLVRLARQNGGQHVYVDLSQLPRGR